MANLEQALKLYKASEVTLSESAKLAELDIYEFMDACKQEKIPVIDVTKEELLEEIQGEVEIHRRDGVVFLLVAKRVKVRSPFDVPRMKTQATTQDILDAVRESRTE